MKNESGTLEFPCSSVEAIPYWGKGQQVKKKIYIYRERERNLPVWS